MASWFLFLAIAILTSACGTPPKKPPVKQVETRATRTDNFIDTALTSAKIVGLSIAVIRDAKVVYAKGYGFSNLAKKTKSTEKTLYLLASAAKPVTAVAALQLVDKGLLKLDKDINTYLSFKVENPSNKNTAITLRHLLSHVSSIQETDDIFQNVLLKLYSKNTDSPIPLLDFCKDYLTPKGKHYNPENYDTKAPGKEYIYSNVGYGLIGHLVERGSKKDFEEYSQANIFGPLKMRKTTWRLAKVDRDQTSTLYKNEYSQVAQAVEPYGFPDYPSGSLRSNVLEMSNFLQMLLNRGMFANQRVLSEASVKQMETVQFPKIDKLQTLGLLRSEAGAIRFYHDGGELGATTLIAYIPQYKLGVVILANTSGDDDDSEATLDQAISAIGKYLLKEFKKTN